MTTLAQNLAEQLIHGSRSALARAITLVESEAERDEEHAIALLDAIRAFSGKSVRIGMSGLPGAGKSSLIEKLGMALVEQEHRVAVLAIDPSSRTTGGSILGDKTRMVNLSRHERAFVRPSPTGRTLGGVAQKSREAVLLCEAAGYDVVMVETVGVGQNELAVRDLVDWLVLVLIAGGGDELQGIKRGLLEEVDLALVNKADGERRALCESYRHDLALSLRVLRGRDVPVLLTSASTGDGLGELWATLLELDRDARGSGALEKRRAQQREHWVETIAEQLLLRRFLRDSESEARLTEARATAGRGDVDPRQLAAELVQRFLD